MFTETPRQAPALRTWSARPLNRSRIDIVASELPANRVSGDISEVFNGSETNLLVAMGDASGHGVAAGMLIIDVRRLLSMMSGAGMSAGEMLTEVNRHVMRRFPTSRFVTLTLLQIDLYTGAFTFASAGQPFYRIAVDGQVSICDSDNAPIGILDDEVFPTIELAPLEKGESLILISDGFREALNDSGEMYGEPRLMAELARHRSAPAKTLIEALHADTDLHKQSNADHDDMTVVVVRTG